MREFTNVLDAMIESLKGNSSDPAKKFIADLERIKRDTGLTAPEARWEIRGSQVSELLDRFMDEHKELPSWLIKLVSIFTTNDISSVEDTLEESGYIILAN